MNNSIIKQNLILSQKKEEIDIINYLRKSLESDNIQSTPIMIDEKK